MSDRQFLISSRVHLERALRAPTPAGLWELRAQLLEAGVPPTARVWPILAEFRKFLDRLETNLSSREYSNLASKLDIGAIGGVVLDQLLEERKAGEFGQRLLMGVLSEGLAVLATRQHVRAWEEEQSAVYRDAAWYLQGELWRWAEELKPELPARERRLLIDRLLAPVLRPETPGPGKAVVIGLLFQVLLLDAVSRDVSSVPTVRTTAGSL